MVKKYFFTFLILFIIARLHSQSISINSDGAAPDASAMLDLQSTSRGFLAPRMTSVEREAITSPATGLLVYDTDSTRYFEYNGSDWLPFNYTISGTSTTDVPDQPHIGQKYFDESSEMLFVYTPDGWAAVVAGTPQSSPYGDESTLTVTFGSSTGNSITISSWVEDASYDGYVILADTVDSFTDLVDGEDTYPATTFAHNGQQVVFDGTTSQDVTVTLLLDQTTYYFKIVPYTGSRVYDNSQASQSATTSTCTTDSETDSEICLSISGGFLTISSNQVPNHITGDFPNYEGDNGEEYIATAQTSVVDCNPEASGSITYVYDETSGPGPSNRNFYEFGIASNGVGFDPMGLKPWTNPGTGEENWAWQAAVVNEGDTDLDAYGGHVTSAGKYHYHGDVTLLASTENGTNHSLIYGWAADGYPIYYKYGYETASDPSSSIVELQSSYQLKSGTRTGSGTAGSDYPDGSYDGTYIQDYEYVSGLGDLDECNGRTGVTPEYPDGTYYYVITSDFPKVPNCFVGTPGSDFVLK